MPRSSTLITAFLQAQSTIAQSFKQPSSLSSWLILMVYLQCLEYSVDFDSALWFASDFPLFTYADLTCYSLIFSCFGIFYVFGSVVIGVAEIQWVGRRRWAGAVKGLQMVFGSVLYKTVVGSNCACINNYFFNQTSSQTIFSLTLSLLSLTLFPPTILLQTCTNYEFLFHPTSKPSTVRTSNYSTVTLLLYITINELTWQSTNHAALIHSHVRNVTFLLHVVVFVLKWEIVEEWGLRVEMFGIGVNLVPILVGGGGVGRVGMGILGVVGVGVAVYNFEYFNIGFELENVHKWKTSQTIMAYASKLQTLLRNYDDPYHNILILGYIQIHEQKCDDETCPLREMSMCQNQHTKKAQFKEMINRIYRDGYRMNPVNPGLLLQYAIFLYQIGCKQKSLKVLLEINQSQLPLDKLYKLVRLQHLIHSQLSKIPNQQFLDPVSQFQLQTLQLQILNKFQQAALLSLQFWPVLNEDSPEFRKLYELGKSRVIAFDEIEALYLEIKSLAFHRKIASIYISFWGLVGNLEKMQEIEEEIKNWQEVEDVIVIQDWENCDEPFVVVSLEQENYGTIVNVNTPFTALLNYSTLSIKGKHINTLFPGVLDSQISSFLDYFNPNSHPFFLLSSTKTPIEVMRTPHLINTQKMGLCLLLTLCPKMQSNSCLLLFDCEQKLLAMSPNSLPFLGLDQEACNCQYYFGDLFEEEERQGRRNILLRGCFGQGICDKGVDWGFNITEKQYTNFSVLTIRLLKKTKQLQSFFINEETPKTISESQAGSSIIYQLRSPIQFHFNTSIQNNKLAYSSSTTSSKDLHSQHSIKMSDEDLWHPGRDFGKDIITLRLQNSYLKVIEEQSERCSEDINCAFDAKSTEKQYLISQADEEAIFKNQKTYNQFVKNNAKPVFVGHSLIFSVIVCCLIYIGIYFQIKNNYESIEKNYYRYALGNRIIGEMASANRLVHQSKYQSLVLEEKSDTILKKNYIQSLTKLQDLMVDYTNPYPIKVFINRTDQQLYRSDEFLLLFISQFANISRRVLQLGLANFTGEDKSSIFIQKNGNITKSYMYPKTERFKQRAQKKSQDSLDMFVLFNSSGFSLSLLLTLIILFSLKKINDYKVEILSVFLEIKDDEVEFFLEKTQKFLTLFHQEDYIEKVEIFDDQAKRRNLILLKKKKFKEIGFSSISYCIFSFFFLFSTGFFMHLFTFTLHNNAILEDAIQYFGVVSSYEDVYSRNQAKVYKKLFKNYGGPAPVFDKGLCALVNTEMFEYERNLFNWHFRTFGKLKSYNQHFTQLYTRDICDNGLNISQSCHNETIHMNGALLLVTDLAIENTLIDYSRPLNKKILLSVEAIKKVHEHLLEDFFKVSGEFFVEIQKNIAFILIVWMALVIICGLVLLFYFHKVIMLDLNLVKSMLVFLPVSWASKSEGVKNFVIGILGKKVK